MSTALVTTRATERTPSGKPQASVGGLPKHATGCSAVSGLPLFLQPKLAISQPTDPAEAEADRVAEQVLRMPAPAVQRQCAACAAGGPPCRACEEDAPIAVARKAEGIGTGDAPASVHSVIRSPGQPLGASVRALFEPRFGQDLSHVRLHTDGEAQQSARDVGALAYTVGSHMVFDAGRFAPGTDEGRRLLAHELTHTIQQSGASNHGASLQRQPASLSETEQSESAVSFTIFVAEERKRRDKRFARKQARADAARIRDKGSLSADDRQLVNAKLRFFQGEAWRTYSETIRPALIEATQTVIEMPAEDVGGGPGGRSSGSAPLPTDVGARFKMLRQFPEYIDNNIKEVNYFTAELAKIHYRDGSTYDLGLIPKWMTPPVVEVDCHTPVHQFRQYADMKTGRVGYIVESELVNVPRTMTYEDLLKTYVRPVEFYIQKGTGRIVPSRINALTAPTLCGVVRDSERRYAEQVNLAVTVGLGGTMAIGPYAGAGGIPKMPGGTATNLGTRTTSRLGGIAVREGAQETAKVMSPIIRYSERDIVVVHTSQGPQAFYRSTGINSKSPNTWFPFDGSIDMPGGFLKARFTEEAGLFQGHALWRYGTAELKEISEQLGKMQISTGGKVGSSYEVNIFLQHFGAKNPLD